MKLSIPTIKLRDCFFLPKAIDTIMVNNEKIWNCMKLADPYPEKMCLKSRGQLPNPFVRCVLQICGPGVAFILKGRNYAAAPEVPSTLNPVDISSHNGSRCIRGGSAWHGTPRWTPRSCHMECTSGDEVYFSIAARCMEFFCLSPHFSRPMNQLKFRPTFWLVIVH